MATVKELIVVLNVSEEALAGWTLDSIVCNDGQSSIPSNGSGNTATFNVESGETVRCVFNNSEEFIPPPGPLSQGCSPGYWKQEQHFDSYVGYTPNTLFADVGFENAFPGQTLLEVLGANGGGLNALGRTIVAALLNATAISGYPHSFVEVIGAFNSAHDGTGDEYNALKEQYEALQDPCPLN